MAIFYFACLALGFVFALLGAIFGELGGHFHIELGGHHVEIDHGLHIGEHGVPLEVDHAMPEANILNTITLSTFVAFFGISGLVSLWIFRLSPGMSLLASFPTSFLIAAAQFFLWVKLFVKAQASSEATLSDILGSEADVAAGIPGGHVGQITYTIRGSRFTAPAVSSDGTDIPRGARVRIVNIRGTTLVVRPV